MSAKTSWAAEDHQQPRGRPLVSPHDRVMAAATEVTYNIWTLEHVEKVFAWVNEAQGRKPNKKAAKGGPECKLVQILKQCEYAKQVISKVEANVSGEDHENYLSPLARQVWSVLTEKDNEDDDDSDDSESKAM